MTIFVEFFGGHAGMSRRDQLHHAVLAGFGQRLHVAFDRCLERLLVLPLRMLGRHRLDAVEREGQLEVHRLLGPQRAVVVEGGDALGGRHEIRPALPRNAGDEIDDRLLGGAVVPRRQRVGLRLRRRREWQATGPNRSGSAAAVATRARRLMPENERIDFMSCFPFLTDPCCRRNEFGGLRQLPSHRLRSATKYLFNVSPSTFIHTARAGIAAVN